MFKWRWSLARKYIIMGQAEENWKMRRNWLTLCTLNQKGKTFLWTFSTYIFSCFFFQRHTINFLSNNSSPVLLVSTMWKLTEALVHGYHAVPRPGSPPPRGAWTWGHQVKGLQLQSFYPHIGEMCLCWSLATTVVAAGLFLITWGTVASSRIPASLANLTCPKQKGQSLAEEEFPQILPLGHKC